MSAESEALYRAFVEVMSEGVLVVDPVTTCIEYTNHSFSKLFLISPEKLVGQCLADLLLPDDRQQIGWLLEVSKRHPAKGHVTLMCPGKPLLACISCTRIPGSDPPAVGVVLSPAVALFESQTLAAAILDQATEAIVLCDRDGRVTHANLAAHQLAGRDPCSLPFNEAFPLKIAKRVFDRSVNGSDIEETLTFSQLSAGGIVRGIRACLATPHEIILLLSAGPIGSPSEEILGTVITLTDISRQTEAETALFASENRYSQVVRQAEEGICLLDSIGTILDANPSLGRILGCEDSELIGRRICDLDFLSDFEPDRARLQEQAGKQALIGERRVTAKDGTRKWVEGSAKMMPNRTLLLIIRDVTERRLLEKEIAEITQREERRIGRELYDLLAQQLAGVSFLTKVLEQKLQAKAPRESKDAHRIGELIRVAIKQARDLAEGLCPMEFNADGLASALQELCRSSEQVSGIPCRFVLSGRPTLSDPATEAQLYLIARELVTASVEQAEASEVFVRFSATDISIELLVEHNGQAGEIEKPFRIVRYRASLIGADLRINPGTNSVQVICSLRQAGA